MKIKNTITNKTINTDTFFKISDFLTKTKKDINVIMAPRNIGKTTEFKEFVKMLIIKGEQCIFLRNKNEEAKAFFDEWDLGENYIRTGAKGAIFEVIITNKVKSIPKRFVGVLCGFGQLKHWRSSNVFTNLKYIIWDEIITSESLEFPENDIFFKFIEHLKTIERFKEELHVYLISNKVATTCDLFWKLNMNFKNINEYQEISYKINDTHVNGYWLPQFHIVNKGESMADNLANLDTSINDYLNSGISYLDNSEDLIKSSDIGKCSWLYTLTDGENVFHIGNLENKLVIYDNCRFDPKVRVYSTSGFTLKPNSIVLSKEDEQDYVELFQKAQNSGNILFSSLFSKNWCKMFIKLRILTK